MPKPALAGLVRGLRRAALAGAGADEPLDGHLLGRFVTCRDGNAFAALVARHGPMVLAVCRRVAGDVHLAEDAFQATFLVLARRAADVKPREALRAWLYGVAVRSARHARGALTRRRLREAPMSAVPDRPAPAEAQADPDDLRLLDEEIAALPVPLRAAVVLCELDGVGRKAAAARLGIPAGTLSSRLAKARTVLAARLRSRGVALSVALVGALSARLAGAVPPPLAEAAARLALGSARVPAPVATLCQGVLRSMFLTKLKAAVLGGALLALAMIWAGLWLGSAALSAQEPVKKRSAAPPGAGPKAKTQGEGPVPRLGGLKAKLKGQRDKVQGLSVEYDYRLEAMVAPELLVRWRLADVEVRHKIRWAFKGPKRYLRITQAQPLAYLPGKHFATDPDAPAEVQQGQKKDRERINKAREGTGLEEIPAEGETRADKAEPFDFTNAFNGKRAWNKNQLGMYVWHAGEGRISSFGRLGGRYLQNVGLLHPDPTMNPGDQTAFWLLPDALELGDYRVREKHEVVDGARCVVLEGKVKAPAGRERPRWAEGVIHDKLWLDLDRGLALRRRELTSPDGRLLERYLNSEFQEVAPGLWLPRACEWQQGSPPWARADVRARPAAAFRMRVVRLTVNDVPDLLFDPPAGAKVLEIKGR